MLRQKNIDDRPPYIEDLIRGGSKPDSEDRLSNIFAATFNHSSVFREIFLKYIKFDKNYDINELRAETQIQFKGSRLDICIKDRDDRILIVIENKLESPLDIEQLEKYNDNIPKIYRPKKIAIIKYSFGLKKNIGSWKIYKWQKFLHKLNEEFDKIGKSEEKFIIKQFINHMEVLNMSIKQEIRKKDFENFCNIFADIVEAAKKKEFKYLPSNKSGEKFFDTGKIIAFYFDEIMKMAFNDPVLKGKLKAYRPPKTRIAFEEDENGNWNINIFNGIEFKNKINNLSGIGIGAYIECLESNKKRNHDIFVYNLIEEDNDIVYGKEEIYHFKKGAIKFDDLADFTIKKFRNFLG